MLFEDMKRSNNLLVIVDGSYIAHRCLAGYPSMINKDGVQINAVYGMIKTISQIQRYINPSHIVVAQDIPGGITFRHKLSSEYKKDRTECPEDLRSQQPLINDALAAWGIKRISSPEMEADDVIGTIATRASAKGAEVIILTGDKDICRVVSPKVKILNWFKKPYVTEESVRVRYGIEPELMSDWLALVGDKGDGIKGVNGIGPVMASTLINKYGGVKQILRNRKKLDGSAAKAFSVVSDKEVLLYLELATMVLDLPIKLNWRSMEIRPDEELQKALIKKLHLRL